MTLTVYVTVDPKGDRPYVSTHPPSPHLDRRGGEVQVYSYDLFLPDSSTLMTLKALMPKELQEQLLAEAAKMKATEVP